MIHIVFDLDGTLADTQQIHQQIESDFLASKWIFIDPEKIGQTYAGRSPNEWIPECFWQNSIDFSQDEIDIFIEWKDERVLDLLKKWKIKLMTWVQKTLQELQKMGIKMGISSGACREFINEFIEYFHLDMIEASTSANEVMYKKPAPDVFNASFAILEKLYGKPSQKWVIWDGKTDIIGGIAAGAKTILCYHDYDIGYDSRIDSFSEILSII